MEVLVMNKSFVHDMVIDTFDSLLWTERYSSCCDFEIYTSVSSDILKVQRGYYLWLEESDTQMIVENIETKDDVEDGDVIVLSGRSLESILDRRIVWDTTQLSGNFQNAIKKLINQNFITPTISSRRINNMVFVDSDDPAITGLTIDRQVTGDNVLELIVELCSAYGVGFRVQLTEDNTFAFSLYAGKDHSYDQDDNPYIVFSPKYENVINSDYIESSQTHKNVSLVAGEDNTVDGKRRTRVVGTASGLDRKELYVDARDIQSETSDGELTESEYNALLDQRGSEKLSECVETTAFDGQLDFASSYKYGIDYFKGDIVQFESGHGQEAKVQIIEVIRSQDPSGYAVYPTFSMLAGGSSAGYSNPTGATGVQTLSGAIRDTSAVAQQALTDADTAATAAASAQASASSAIQQAVAASQAASAAQTSANAAQASANQAASAASAAQSSANQAISDAAAASSAASAAQSSATTANTAANNALTQLSTVQDVVGIVEWAATHSQQDMADYINSHLSLTTYGLNLTLDNSSYRIHIGTYTENGDDGVYIIDDQGDVVTFFGESIDFSSSRPQYIGGEDAYILFYDSDNDGVPDSINIGGTNVTLGGDKHLSDLLTELDISTRQTATGAEITIGDQTVTLDNGSNGEDAVLLCIDSSKGLLFKNNQVSTVLNVTIYKGGATITTQSQLTSVFGAGAHLQWYWMRLNDSTYGQISASDSRLSDSGFHFTLTPSDVDVKVTFKCELIL